MADELTAPAPVQAESKPTRPDPISAIIIYIGDLSILFWRALRMIFTGGIDVPDLLEQMATFGVDTIPISMLTSLASGGVLSLYFAPLLNQYGGQQFTGGIVAIAIARELAPVLAGVTVSARSGSMVAAEIGTMKVTEQIDALRALAVSPIRYLAVPRLLAAVIMLPVICVLADAAGIFGGYLVGVYMEGVPPSVFTNSIQNLVMPSDFYRGMIKTIFFGLIIALIGCNEGLKTRGGATEVGRATTNTVVISIVMIYLVNFVLADMLFPQ